MATFKHRKGKYTFRVTIDSVKDGLWIRYRATALCPLCKNELRCGFSGRIQKETEVKSSIKSACNKHLLVNHYL